MAIFWVVYFVKTVCTDGINYSLPEVINKMTNYGKVIFVIFMLVVVGYVCFSIATATTAYVNTRVDIIKSHVPNRDAIPITKQITVDEKYASNSDPEYIITSDNE
jgi:hypothetical protein